MAVFTLDNDRTRTVHFGSAGASDYTQHRDPVRKRQYLARHAPREHWENPMTAGALAGLKLGWRPLIMRTVTHPQPPKNDLSKRLF